jgi:SAM-dependent methyltransferase
VAQKDRERWNALYRERGPGGWEPGPFLLSIEDLLPRRGRALDVAGGSGRNALWLARRGLAVTVADISEVALGMAEARARAQGLNLDTVAVDLESGPLPGGPWDLIVCVNFLHRPLFRVFPEALAGGGLLAVCQPTRTHLTRHSRPGPRFVLEVGELPGLVAGLEVLLYQEGWFADRHEARLVARRPP